MRGPAEVGGHLFQMGDLGAVAVRVLLAQHGEVHVGVAGAERVANFAAAGVHDRRARGLQRLGLAPQLFAVEELAVMVEGVGFGPQALDQLEPFRRVVVAPVVRRQLQAEHVELVLEPAGHDVEREAAARDVVGGGGHLGHGEGVDQRGVHGGEDRAVAGDGAHGGGPGQALEGAVVEVGLAAIALPAADRQQDLEPGRVGHAGQFGVVLPVHRPGAVGRGDGRAVRAVEGHHAELDAVGAEQGVCHDVSRFRPGFVAGTMGAIIPSWRPRWKNRRRGCARC